MKLVLTLYIGPHRFHENLGGEYTNHEMLQAAERLQVRARQQPEYEPPGFEDRKKKILEHLQLCGVAGPTAIQKAIGGASSSNKHAFRVLETQSLVGRTTDRKMFITAAGRRALE